MVSLVARISTTDTVTGVVALLTGIVSVYSSTSGVVLPAFLPLVPGLAAQLPGASAVGIAMSMNIGGHLVDVSPLSTIGALCIASAAADDSPRAVQPAAGVGTVDGGRRRGALLRVVLSSPRKESALMRVAGVMLVALLACTVVAQEHQHRTSPDEKLGTTHFVTSCTRAVQPAFDRAVALLHSFDFPRAAAAFESVASADPSCGMAYGVSR